VSGVTAPLWDGEHLTGYAKIARDLTEQRQAQEERERLLKRVRELNDTLEQKVEERTEELRRSEVRFSQAFHAGPVAACITTLEKEHFLEVNEMFTQLTGYTREEVVGRTAFELAMWSSREDQETLVKASRQGGSFRNLELRLRTKEGAERDILLSGEVIQLDGERGNLKLFYDVTERKRTETQLMQAIQEVMSDTAWFSQRVMEQLAHLRSGKVEPAPRVDLTARERQVLERLARGLGNDAIAEELGIAKQTVRNYISIVYEKLGVHSRAEAVVWARERGLVGP